MALTYSTSYYEAGTNPISTNIVARSFVTLTLIVFCWSGTRIGGFTVYDIFSPVALLICALMAFQFRINLRGPVFSLILASLCCLVLGVAISGIGAFNFSEHIARGVSVVLSFSTILLLYYIGSRLNVLTLNRVTFWLLISATISCVVSIAQKYFGLLKGLSPQYYLLNGADRHPGLAEHPIEAGTMAAYAIIMAFYLLNSPKSPGYQRIMCLGFLIVDIFSLTAPSSLTSIITCAVAVIVFLIVSRKAITFGVTAAIVMVAGSIALPFLENEALGDRINGLIYSGTDYTTVETRSQQMSMVWGNLDAKSVIFGRGFSVFDLPTGIEIHNSLLAAVYHYGVLGLFSQIFALAALVWLMIRESDKLKKAYVLALFVIFLGAYLTGPTLTRRSIWVPLFATAMSLTAASGPKRDLDREYRGSRSQQFRR